MDLSVFRAYRCPEGRAVSHRGPVTANLVGSAARLGRLKYVSAQQAARGPVENCCRRIASKKQPRGRKSKDEGLGAY
jgi:hypothetical protein